ncbi:MAG: FMN-binding negative transcriptional regulator [Balneolaceae bacterium]
MYNTSYFKEKDLNQILEFIREHPFAFITGSFNDGTQVATQVPCLLVERDGEYFIQAHLMRKTDHHRAFLENPNALVVFTGPHTYVSATWYSDARMGSTWNYMSVHVSGEVRLLEDAELGQFMKDLTLRFEGGNTESPTYFDNLPNEYLASKMPAIIGFELKLEKIDNVFKLSQNKDEESYRKIISELEKQEGDSAKIAKEMKKRIEELF